MPATVSVLPALVLHPILQGFEANDPLVFPLVEAALDRKTIVYVTGGAPYLAMPYKIADLAGHYPEGAFVMGHAGWDFHFDVPYCLEACPNLWAETSRNGFASLESLVNKFGTASTTFTRQTTRWPKQLGCFPTASFRFVPLSAAEVRRCLESGFKGVKFHPWLQSFPANSAYCIRRSRCARNTARPSSFTRGRRRTHSRFRLWSRRAGSLACRLQ